MTKKKTLFKNISLFLCLVPMLVLSLFCLVPKKEDLKVSAFDSSRVSFSFNGSEIIIPCALYTNGTNFHETSFLTTLISFSVDYDRNLSVNITGTYLSKTWGNALPFSFVANDVSYIPNGTEHLIHITSNYYIKVTIWRSTNVVYNHMSSVNIKSYSYITTLKYNDVNDNYITIGFGLESNSADAWKNDFLLDERTYYFTPADLTENQYYDLGYNDGYDKGLVDGNEDGYKDGYDVGVNVGYGNGYNEGVANSQDYSFLSLIGAVIDAPVSAFTSLLNFNLLGFNMLAFVTGLITLGVILLIVKLFIGGK